MVLRARFVLQFGRFARGEKEDAADLVLVLLQALDGESGAFGVVRSTFGVSVRELTACGACGRRHTTARYTQLTQSVSVHEFLSQAAQAPALSGGSFFATICRKVVNLDVPCNFWDETGTRGLLCTAGKGALIPTLRSLEARPGSYLRGIEGHDSPFLSDANVLPGVFTIAFGWPGDTASKEEIEDLMKLIPVGGLNVRSFFDNLQPTVDPTGGGGDTHCLDGFIAFYMGHYVAYWRRLSSRDVDEWESFDDALVKHVGGWGLVVEKVVASKAMPLLLFYSGIKAKP
jgi:hypothetical protein